MRDSLASRGQTLRSDVDAAMTEADRLIEDAKSSLDTNDLATAEDYLRPRGLPAAQGVPDGWRVRTAHATRFLWRCHHETAISTSVLGRASSRRPRCVRCRRRRAEAILRSRHLRRPPKAAASGVDTVIALVKGGMSEALVIKTLQAEGKTYTLTTADLLKLQAAGVSEGIMHAMTEPKDASAATATAAAPAAAPAAAASGPAKGATAYPPDLADLPPRASGGSRYSRSTTRPSRPG